MYLITVSHLSSPPGSTPLFQLQASLSLQKTGRQIKGTNKNKTKGKRANKIKKEKRRAGETHRQARTHTNHKTINRNIQGEDKKGKKKMSKQNNTKQENLQKYVTAFIFWWHWAWACP